MFVFSEGLPDGEARLLGALGSAGLTAAADSVAAMRLAEAGVEAAPLEG